MQDWNAFHLYIDADNDSETGLEFNGIGAELDWTFGQRQGVFYFNGKINIVHIYNSTIKNVFSGDNGGVVYFNGDKDSSEIEFKNNFVSNGPNSESSLNGGIMFCTNLKELHMSNNKDLSSINVEIKLSGPVIKTFNLCIY